MKSFILYFLCFSACCLILAVPMWSAPEKRLNTFEPPDGTVLHGAGQSSKYFDSYCDVLPEDCQPAIFMMYSSILSNAKSPRSGDEKIRGFKKYIEAHPYAIPQIGFSFGSRKKMKDREIAEGNEKELKQIRAWGAALKESNRPIFVRLGFEFNGKHNGYDPKWYPKAFRKIVETWREQGVDNVAYVWCATGGCGPNTSSYYPGDDYVDWWAWDSFGKTMPTNHAAAFMKDAEKHGKPVMIGESSPRGLDTRDGKATWDKWHKKYFTMIERYPVIKAFCYINWDWEGINPDRWKKWGYACIDGSDYVLEHYTKAIQNKRFLHADESLWDTLGFSPRDEKEDSDSSNTDEE